MHDNTRHCIKTQPNDSSIVSEYTSNMMAAAMAAIATCPIKHGRPSIKSVHQIKKVAHNAIEHRYRNNINDRIEDLKNVVPALYMAKIKDNKKGTKRCQEKDNDSSDREDQEGSCSQETDQVFDGVVVAKKLSKATILYKATKYIYHLKHINELAERENEMLQQILAQMPGGPRVLTQFQAHKADLQRQEQERLVMERKESIEREKAERQRLLHERAAQRATLAELIPKLECRRPYHKRSKKEAAKE